MKNQIIYSSIVVLIIGSFALITHAQQSASSCITCHSSGLTGYSKWVNSPHGRNQIGCENCHGGRSDLDNKSSAHSSLLENSNVLSPLNPENLPSTCAQCHTEAPEGYNSSKHYEAILNGKKAPTCITCHGSKGEKIIKDQEVNSFCSSCHKNEYSEEIMDAEEVVFYNSELKIQETLFQSQIEKLSQSGYDVTTANRAFDVLINRYRKALLSFHADDYKLSKMKSEFVTQQIAVVKSEIDKLQY
jgi:hypothetical protein